MFQKYCVVFQKHCVVFPKHCFVFHELFVVFADMGHRNQETRRPLSIDLTSVELILRNSVSFAEDLKFRICCLFH